MGISIASLVGNVFRMRIKNYYYFIAGILAILFSVTHELNGQLAVIPSLNKGNSDVNIITTFTYVWHIITVENLIFGVAFITMAFCKNKRETQSLAWIISVVMIARLFVIIGVTFVKIGSVESLSIDIIAILLYTLLIFLGARVGRRGGNKIVLPKSCQGPD